MATLELHRGHAAALNGASAPVLVRGAGETDVGHVRSANQDVIVVDPDLGLYAVLDGMGGQNAGNIAAQLASEEIARIVRETREGVPREVLEDALMTASAAVLYVGTQIEQCQGMGTTAVACLVVDQSRAVIAHLGDSRAYLLRSGELSQLTRDHSAAQELVDQGKLTARSARRRPEAHILTRCVGGGGHAEVQELPLKPGDRLLLCSDGLHGYTRARSIRRVLAGDGTPEQLAHELVALALRGRAPDNVSALVISVGGDVAPPRARRART